MMTSIRCCVSSMPGKARIKELNGPDYRKLAPRELDKEGREVAGSRGYKYFGAAKDLPGVRELFEQQAEEGGGPPKRSRAELTKNLDATYYGYMDEDDGWLIPLEKSEEQKLIARRNAEWKEKGPEMNRVKGVDDDIYKVEGNSDEEEEFDIKESVVKGEDGREMIIRHVMVPSQKDIEEMIIERKKQNMTAECFFRTCLKRLLARRPVWIMKKLLTKLKKNCAMKNATKILKIAEDAREKAEAVEKQNRGKGAEFAFSYDTNDETADDGLSGESDEEDTEVYEPPEGLKLPVGINLPPTAKMGHIIERTANFVALQGNQMEIIIKVKHRDHKDRFGFLDFDNPLNSFYKYICKLIREKKYVPKPPKKKLLPGEHTVQQRPENFDSDGEEDSDDGDYLHPLLLASKAKTISTAPVAPVPVPVSSTKNNPYSSLYGSLYGIDQNETQEDESPKEKEQTPPKEEVKQPEQIPVETDAMEIHNYNIWHQWFYSRPSIFLPNPPIKPKTPPADLLSQINVAAKFVAANGAYSERNLLEHNRGRLNFLYPNSEYLVYYHCKLRFFQARLNPRVMPCVYSKYHRQFELEIPLQTYQPAPPPPETKQQETKASVDQLPTSTSVNIPEAPTPPETIQISEFPITNFESDDSEDIKRKRRERAQQFMNDIIKTKKSGSSREKPQNEKPKKKEDVVVPADIAIPNLITSLVTGQLEKLKPVSKEPSEPPTRNEERPKGKEATSFKVQIVQTSF
ncbi:hypothetical protein M3Y97_00097300 [Aphelenchoides bicaudatus]|nr:hypothetical protein M3Y97_00097300 [Aphelenchoides bicaudatus]